MIGLKRGTVEIHEHEPEWDTNAVKTIEQLKQIFGNAACDIQHIGSTSIKHIKAKPIIDIAVAVDSYDLVTPLINTLNNAGLTCYLSAAILKITRALIMFI